jgi:hypothetical protein
MGTFFILFREMCSRISDSRIKTFVAMVLTTSFCSVSKLCSSLPKRVLKIRKKSFSVWSLND